MIHFKNALLNQGKTEQTSPYIVLESLSPWFILHVAVAGGNNSALLPLCFSFSINEVQGSSGSPPGGQVGTARLHGARELP